MPTLIWLDATLVKIAPSVKDERRIDSPVDTTDIRAVIADGADEKDLKDYFENGGSSQLDDLLGNAENAEQEAQQLNQILKVMEIAKPAQEEK